MAKQRRASLSALSINAIHAELQRRQQRTAALHRQRARLMRKLSAVEAKIQSLGGAVDGVGSGAPGRKRAKNATNLVEALVKVLKGRTMGVTEVAAAVQRAGYRTTSKTFRTIVNQALIKHTNRFKKIERGQYTAA